jgi:signal transduction histidine kinase
MQSACQQIIWNLLSNAIKFTPKGGTVQVELKQVESFAEITVTDSGIGIESEFLPFVLIDFGRRTPRQRAVTGALDLDFRSCAN